MAKASRDNIHFIFQPFYVVYCMEFVGVNSFLYYAKSIKNQTMFFFHTFNTSMLYIARKIYVIAMWSLLTHLFAYCVYVHTYVTTAL